MDKFHDVTPDQAAQEILRRRRARDTLIGFTEYTKQGYKADPVHHLIASKLEAVERGEIRRLMIFTAPRIGKSELSTRRFPAWFMARNPTKNVISASYNADFAKGFGRNVRDIIQSPEFARIFPDVAIRADNRSADEWQLEKGGQYYAVGVGTSTTGRGASIFLIDDPVKDRKEADSQSVREDQWNWYRDVVYTRLEEDAAIVLTLTRWHTDDIAGRLVELMDQGKGVPWEILSLPALPIFRRLQDGTPVLLDDGTVPGDPLGRRPNDPISPSRFSLAALLDRQEVLGERSWNALYQQQPMSEEGGMFHASWFGEAGELSPRRTRVRAWDFGATINGDFTAGVLMSRDPAGTFVVEDVIRVRDTPMRIEDLVLRTAQNDGRATQIIIPQDPGQAGVSQANNYTRKLAGYKVKAVRPTGPKITRAEAFAAQCEAGNVKLVKRMWNGNFLDEISTFPLGSHDDQVDAASDAFNALLGPRKAAIIDW